jgi:hypothetical protein
MEEVLPSVEHEEYLSTILIGNLKQIYSLIELEDFTASHYVYNRYMAVVKIEQHMPRINFKKCAVLIPVFPSL